MEARYGLISDIHTNPLVVHDAIREFQRLGVDKILVNGDIGDNKEKQQHSVMYMDEVAGALGRSEIETYVLPGSHEPLGLYKTVMTCNTSRYPNLIDATGLGKIHYKGHDIVFIPGSDFVAGGEYSFGAEKLRTGEYMHKKRKMTRLTDMKEYNRLVKYGRAFGMMSYKNIKDIKRLVTEPEKTIILCHVPRRFDNIVEAVDMAYFAEDARGGAVAGDVFEKYVRSELGERLGSAMAELGRNFGVDITKKNTDRKTLQELYKMVMKSAAKSKGWNLKTENRGSVDLKKLYEQLGITKAVSGHFHESSHRANDLKGKHVKEGRFVKDLFWNSGFLDAGHCGILTVKENKVKYQNIEIELL